MDNLTNAVTAELAAVVGEALNDLEFSKLVDKIVAERRGRLAATTADTAAYTVIPHPRFPGEYAARYADGSMGPIPRGHDI